VPGCEGRGIACHGKIWENPAGVLKGGLGRPMPRKGADTVNSTGGGRLSERGGGSEMGASFEDPLKGRPRRSVAERIKHPVETITGRSYKGKKWGTHKGRRWTKKNLPRAHTITLSQRKSPAEGHMRKASRGCNSWERAPKTRLRKLGE